MELYSSEKDKRCLIHIFETGLLRFYNSEYGKETFLNLNDVITFSVDEYNDLGYAKFYVILNGNISVLLTVYDEETEKDLIEILNSYLERRKK